MNKGNNIGFDSHESIASGATKLFNQPPGFHYCTRDSRIANDYFFLQRVIGVVPPIACTPTTFFASYNHQKEHCALNYARVAGILVSIIYGISIHVGSEIFSAVQPKYQDICAMSQVR